METAPGLTRLRCRVLRIKFTSKTIRGIAAEPLHRRFTTAMPELVGSFASTRWRAETAATTARILARRNEALASTRFIRTHGISPPINLLISCTGIEAALAWYGETPSRPQTA